MVSTFSCFTSGVYGFKEEEIGERTLIFLLLVLGSVNVGFY